MVTTITSRNKRNRISTNGHTKTSKPIVEYLGMEIDNKLVDRDTRTTLVQYIIQYIYTQHQSGRKHQQKRVYKTYCLMALRACNVFMTSLEKAECVIVEMVPISS